MFTQAKEDALEGLTGAIDFYVAGFQGLPQEEDAQDSVARYREKVERVLQLTDQVLTPLLLRQDNSDVLLTNWAARMGSCRRMMDTLDKNLAFKGQRQWNWDEVIQAMSFLEAVIKGAQGTLRENGVDY